MCVCVCVRVCMCVCVCACVECCLRAQEMLLSAGSTVLACSPQTLHNSYDRNLTPDRSSTLQDEIIRRSVQNRRLQRLMSTTGSRCLERSASWTDKDAQIAMERGAGGSSKLKSASKRAVSVDLGTTSVTYRWVGGVFVCTYVCVRAYVCMGLSVWLLVWLLAAVCIVIDWLINLFYSTVLCSSVDWLHSSLIWLSEALHSVLEYPLK